MNSRAKSWLFAAFLGSLGVHGIAYASLSGSGREAPQRDFVSEVSFEVKPLPESVPVPELAPPPPPPEPAPTKISTAITKVAPPAAAANIARTPSPPALVPAPAPALDLSGVTLTNDTSTGFAMPIGDGSALHAPIGGRNRSAEPSRMAPVSTAGTSPALVAPSDLSVHPVPPALGGLLRANYPEDARQRGLRGTASVRGRIDADGVLRSARVLSETAAGFGAACRRTVAGSHWSAPRDKKGSAVATEIVYTCHFEVDQ